MASNKRKRSNKHKQRPSRLTSTVNKPSADPPSDGANLGIRENVNANHPMGNGSGSGSGSGNGTSTLQANTDTETSLYHFPSESRDIPTSATRKKRSRGEGVVEDEEEREDGREEEGVRGEEEEEDEDEDQPAKKTCSRTQRLRPGNKWWKNSKLQNELRKEVNGVSRVKSEGKRIDVSSSKAPSYKVSSLGEGNAKNSSTSKDTTSHAWDKQMAERRRLKLAKERERELIAKRIARKQEERKAKIEKEKRRAENELKSMTWQELKNTDKVKKMSKKQLRQLKKTRVDENGITRLVGIYD